MKTVLVIEDNRDIRENTCELLEVYGYRVFTATDGIMGISLAREHKPDIVICDIMMPGANGYEVLVALRNDEATAHIPFVFFTSSVEKKEVDAGMGLGANGYIRKPFEPEELFGTINKCLNK